MSNKEEAQAALAAALESLAAEQRRHEAARADLAECQASLDATDPDDRRALDKAIAAHGTALARSAALAGREGKAAAAVEGARAAVAAVEQAEIDAKESARRAEIAKVKAHALARLNEARECCDAAFARLAELGEPREPLPSGSDVGWEEDERGRTFVRLRMRRVTSAAPEPAGDREGYDRLRLAVGLASAPRAEVLAEERAIDVAREVGRYEVGAERLKENAQ